MASSVSVASRLLRISKDGSSLLLSVAVKPGARTSSIAFSEESLELRVTAQPHEGEANADVIKTVASILGVGKSSVEIVRGHTSRQKTVSVAGLSYVDAIALLTAATTPK